MAHNTETKMESKRSNQFSNIEGFLHSWNVSEGRGLFATAYMALLVKKHNLESESDLASYIESIESDPRKMFLKEYFKETSEVVFKLAATTDEDCLADYIKYYPHERGKFAPEYGTPEALSKLAMRILDIKKGDSLADFGSGSGDYITIVGSEHKSNPIFGIELVTQLCEVSRIRSEVCGINAEIELGDMFNLSNDRKYDKIFSNYPFGLRPAFLSKENEYYNTLLKRIPDVKRITSSDWIFNALIVDHLSENGKAVAIMTNGSTWNTIDAKIREHFIREGLVEAVIALPDRLFECTNVQTTMIVLSKNNKSVRLINATDMYVPGRRQSILTDENIDNIIKALEQDGEVSISVDVNGLQQNDFALNPARYTEREIEVKNGVEFGSLIKRITRGAQINAHELDELVSEKPTDTRYLMLSHIKDGLIAEDLPYLKELDPRYDKYLIKNHNLLLSKNGAPFKVAIAELDESERLLGNGNLFIIELDDEKVNPFYMKAFFDSEMGMIFLKSISVGTSIPNIPAEALKRLIVPLPPLEEQNAIAEMYQAKADEIRVLQYRLKKAQSELKGIFGEVK